MHIPLFQILALYPLEQAKETQWSDCNEISKMTTHTRTQNLLYYKDRQTWEVQSLPLDSKTIFGLPDGGGVEPLRWVPRTNIFQMILAIHR